MPLQSRSSSPGTRPFPTAETIRAVLSIGRKNLVTCKIPHLIDDDAAVRRAGGLAVYQFAFRVSTRCGQEASHISID